MKHAFLTILLLLSCHLVMGQFTLTPQGLRDCQDLTKEYVVLNFDGQSKSELFSKTKNYLTQRFVSAKDVISESGDDVITANCILSIAAKTEGKGAIHETFSTIVFSFKDEKIRVQPNIIEVSQGEPWSIGFAGAWIVSIFNKKGELKYPEFALNIEDKFNKLFITELSSYLNEGTSDNDW